MTLEEFKTILRRVALGLRDELIPGNKEVLNKFAENSISSKLEYGGKPLEPGISADFGNIISQRADGLYAGNNYVTSESSPVGEVIAFMGTSCPKHYLICDGTEYQLGHYPLLEAFFKDQFGSVNHFGGDGTTTFAVPDLRGEFLRGSGTAERNTGSGTDVGEHQNGTVFPMVKAVSGSNTLVVVAADTEYETKETADTYIEGVIRRVTSFTGGTDLGGVKFTFRPTNTSVLYCIKYEPTYFTTIDQIYNYKERCIGKWIDGKPLYEKTVNFGSLPNATTKKVPHGIEDVDMIWINNAFVLAGADRYPIVFYNGTSNYWYRCVNAKTVEIFVANNGTDFTAIVTIRYTKTTDQSKEIKKYENK